MTRCRRSSARPIESECPYLWLDATFHKVREAGRVISVATVVAIGVTATGERTVLGAATGPSEDHQFWTSFLRQLVKRGLRGVRLVISDAHEGLRQAIAKILHEATWQRCRVHFMRNLLSTVPKRRPGRRRRDRAHGLLPARPPSAMNQLHEVARMLHPKFPQATELLEDAAEDVLAHLHFPREHRRRLHSTNPLERSAQGDQAPDPRRRDLPDPGLADADGRDAARRAGRRVAGLRPPLLQRRLDDQGGRPRRR